MDKKNIQKNILNLLKTSSISAHDKEMIQLLLPAMKMNVLEDVYNALLDESKKMRRLDEKLERIEFKYKVMVEKLCDLELKKKSSK